MKKSMHMLITITLVFVGLIAGIFIGRNSVGTWIALAPSSGNIILTTASSQESTEIGKVNINTAEKNELTLLPGVGSTKAAKIIEFREEFGRFTRIEDLIYVDGFSHTTIEELRPYITVGG